MASGVDLGLQQNFFQHSFLVGGGVNLHAGWHPDAHLIGGKTSVYGGLHRPGWTFYLGSFYDVSHLYRMGADVKHYTDICQESCLSPEELKAYSEMSGWLFSVGLLVGTDVSLSPNLGLNVSGSIQNDGSRWHTGSNVSLRYRLRK